MNTTSAQRGHADSIASTYDQQGWLQALAPHQLQDLPALIAHAGVEGALAGQGLACAQVQRACDMLASLYEASDGRAGLVGVAAPGTGANAGQAEIVENVRRTWWALNRPNALVALPATAAGIAALEDAVYTGINVQASGVFTLAQLQAVRKAQRRGLARRLEQRLSVQRLAVTAALELASIDAAVNALLPRSAAHLRDLAGSALAQLACEDARGGEGFAVFAAFGAVPPRLMWAAGSGPQSGATIALHDFTAGSEGHSRPAISPAHSPASDPRSVLAQLARHGIDLETIGNGLLYAGLRQLSQAPSKLLALPGWPGTITEFQEPPT